MTITARRSTPSHSGECETCQEFRGDGDVLAWARRHAASTGHTVVVVMERLTTFYGAPKDDTQ